MNTKLFTGLTAAALLLIGGPAFGYDHRDGGGRPAARHAVAAAHRSVSVARHTSVAAVRRAPAARSFVARRSTGVTHAAYAANRSTNIARTRSTNIARGNTSTRSRNSVAFGGHANYAQNGNNGRQYAFASHGGWNHGQQYFWHGHHYGWYGNGWYIIAPFPYYGYNYYSPTYTYGGNVAVQVQNALYQAGYYQGPIDGIVGPGTSAAIAAYQRDNGLRVTGTITPGLVQNLGVG